MALKKPSDFFGNNKKTPLDEVKESYESARPEKIEQVSEAFDAFKSNLNHIQSLSDFTSTFDSFKNNLEKVESVSSEVSEIKEEIKSLIKKEDLDSAMMAQLLFVEESISKIESKVSSINGKTVDKIREDFVNLSNSVESFLDLDVPKYKKLISESEVRFDDRLGVFKGQVEENLESIKETVESVNENTINIVKAEFKETAGDLNKNVNELVEKELPKYKKLFAETELKTEETIKNAIDSYKETIESLNAKVKVFTETEIPKYNNLLVETKLKSEQEVKNLEQEVLSRVNNLTEKVQSISEGIPEKISEKIQELKEVTDEYKEEIDSISKKYQTLYKDFKNRKTSEDKTLESYSKDIEKYQKRFNFLEETVSEDLKEIQNVLTESNETYQTNLNTEVNKLRDKISEQMRGLEVDLVTNEKHIKKHNESIKNIQEELKVVLENLQLDVLEKKNAQLIERINHVEEVFSKINEKTLLTEDNPTLPGDPSTNNSDDPLTPIDQKYVTLEQLQQHYKLFVQRVQTQLATIGGGGETRLRYLDDIVGIATNLSAYDGMYLGIDASNSAQPFVFSSVSGGGGGGTGAGGTWSNYDSNTGVTTTKKVKIQNNLEVTGVTTSTGGFVGNLTGTATGLSGTPDITIRNITGVAATFTGVLTYEDVTNIDSVGLITARTGINVLAGGINVTGVSTFNDQVHMPDNTKLMFGESNDLQIIHIPGNSNSIQGTSPLFLQTTSEIHLREYGGSQVFGKFIKNGAVELYHSGNKKFETTGAGATVYGTTETQQLNVTGVSTISTGVGTVHVGVGSTTLLVDGDARVTGILTIGSGSITLDPTAKKIEGIDEIIIGTGTTVRIHQDTSGEIAFSDRDGKQASVGIGTTVSINTSGIITASSFVGSVTGTASNASGATGDFSIADKIVHTGDTNTAIRFPAADTVTVETSGSEALRVDSSGRLLLGTTTEGAALADNFTVADSADCGITIRSGTSNYGSIYFSDATSGADEYRGQIEYNHNTDILRFYSGGTAVLRIDPGKLEVIGHTETDTLNASGIITASSFRGDGSQLTNIISGVGIQSGSVRVGTGFTDINFTGAGVTVVGSGTTVTVDIPTSTITRQTETSSGVTTDFTITGGYTVGLIDVFVNGVKQINGSDFTATDGSTVTMTPNVTDGDIVEFQKFDVAVSGESGITTANIVSDSLIVSGVSTFSSAVGINSDLTLTNTDSGSSAGPEFKLYRNSASSDDSDYLGQIKFAGESDTGVERNYAKITGKIGDASNGAEDGVIEIDVIKSGTETSVARFKNNQFRLLNNTELSVAGDILANGNITGDDSTSISGISSVTATSFYGSGANLTGVISGVEVKNNGTSVGTGITAINFSTNVTATASGGIATVTASGGGGGGSDGPSSVMMGMIF